VFIYGPTRTRNVSTIQGRVVFEGFQGSNSTRVLRLLPNFNSFHISRAGFYSARTFVSNSAPEGSVFTFYVNAGSTSPRSAFSFFNRQTRFRLTKKPFLLTLEPIDSFGNRRISGDGTASRIVLTHSEPRNTLCFFNGVCQDDGSFIFLLRFKYQVFTGYLHF